MAVKLLVLGIDGMSCRVVQRCRSRLPFLAELQERSLYGVLHSVKSPEADIPHTGPAWSSIYTGCPPQEHGILSGGWLTEHQNFSDLKKITIWEVMNRRYMLCLFCMPMTFPPFPLNGWMISGFPAPPATAKSVYPKRICGYLGPSFAIDYIDLADSQTWRDDFHSHEALALEDERLKTFKRIFTDYPTQVVAYGTTCLDRYGHVYPQYPSEGMARLAFYCRFSSRLVHSRYFAPLSACIDRCLLHLEERLVAAYEYVDRLAADLCGFLRPEHLLICSDHGFFNYGFPGAAIHDLYGYYCLSSAGSGPRREPRTLLDIAPMICRTLDLDCAELGQDVARERHGLDVSEHKKLSSKLAALGYL